MTGIKKGHIVQEVDFGNPQNLVCSNVNRVYKIIQTMSIDKEYEA